MGHEVRQSLVFALADALMMKIESKPNVPYLRGSAEHIVDFNGLKVPFKVKIVSALLHRSRHMILARVKGNLAVLVIAETGTSTRTILHILNLAKMGQSSVWLEDKRPKDSDEAVEMLGKAVVRSFTRGGYTKWAPVT